MDGRRRSRDAGAALVHVGLHRDFEAVTAGLTLPYNSGAVEGTVNKIKGPQDAAVRTCEARPAEETDTAVLKVANTNIYRRRPG